MWLWRVYCGIFGCVLRWTILNENLLARVYVYINIYAYVRVRGEVMGGVLEAFLGQKTFSKYLLFLVKNH